MGGLIRWVGGRGGGPEDGKGVCFERRAAFERQLGCFRSLFGALTRLWSAAFSHVHIHPSSDPNTSFTSKRTPRAHLPTTKWVVLYLSFLKASSFLFFPQDPSIQLSACASSYASRAGAACARTRLFPSAIVLFMTGSDTTSHSLTRFSVEMVA